MDRRERVADPQEALRMAMEGGQSKIWTSLPGIVKSFDAARMVCNVQPSISGIQRLADGTTQAIQMPLLLDCPVVFPGGGGVTLTFPIAPGDECLVMFASRCIDAWWQLGGVQGQAEFRMHDLSDGFVFPGVRSQPRKFTVSTSAAQMRSDDGTTLVELNPAAKTLHLVAPNGATIDANTTINGTLTVSGAITSAVSITAPNVVGTIDVTFGSKSGIGHVHSGVQSGPSNSGAPV